MQIDFHCRNSRGSSGSGGGLSVKSFPINFVHCKHASSRWSRIILDKMMKISKQIRYGYETDVLYMGIGCFTIVFDKIQLFRAVVSTHTHTQTLDHICQKHNVYLYIVNRIYDVENFVFAKQKRGSKSNVVSSMNNSWTSRQLIAAALEFRAQAHTHTRTQFYCSVHLCFDHLSIERNENAVCYHVIDTFANTASEIVLTSSCCWLSAFGIGFYCVLNVCVCVSAHFYCSYHSSLFTMCDCGLTNAFVVF